MTLDEISSLLTSGSLSTLAISQNVSPSELSQPSFSGDSHPNSSTVAGSKLQKVREAAPGLAPMRAQRLRKGYLALISATLSLRVIPKSKRFEYFNGKAIHL